MDDSNGLEIGIHDRTANETHAAFSKVIGDLIRECGSSATAFVDCLTVGKRPYIMVKAAIFCLNLLKYSGILNSRSNFAAIADNASILHQLFYFYFAICADDGSVKAIEGAAKRFPLVENAFPG